MPIAGVLSSTGQDQSPHVREALATMCSTRTTSDVLSRGPACLGFCPGSADAYRASAHTDPGMCDVLFEGVLFDRQKLIERLSLRVESLSDACLVASAWRQWGAGAFERLDGEFTLALWDQQMRTLTICRDAMGRGGLVYSREGNTFSFATEVRGLVRLPGVSARLDDRYLAGMMILHFEPGRTAFEGVRSPPPGYLLTVQPARPERLLRFWDPAAAPQWQAQDPRRYAEAICDAMTSAVERRLPAQGTVVSELSAGYDSSAVTTLAARALQRQDRPLIAYTSVPAQGTDASRIMRNAFADEWPLAASVVRRYRNIEHLPVPSGAAAWLESLDAMTDILGSPPLFLRNVQWMYAIRKRAHERGAVTVLCGQNGNLSGSYAGDFALYDLLRRGQIGALIRTALAWRRAGAGWRSLLHRAWLPTTRTRDRLRRIRGGGPADDFGEQSLFRRELIREAGLRVPESAVMGSTMQSVGRTGAARRFSNMQLLDFGSSYAAERRRFSLQRSDPTADRKLVELCLTIPDQAFAPKGKPRELYREAMKQVLPDEILQERRLGLQSSDFLENFAAGMPQWHEEIRRLEASKMAACYLHLPRLRSLLESFPQRVAASRAKADLAYNYTFGGALALGRFLRRFEEGTLHTD